MFIDTTVYYSLYIIIDKLTKGVPATPTPVYSNSFLLTNLFPLPFTFPHLYIYYSSLNNLIYT